MANAKPTKSALIKKKKRWYTVVAPKEMNSIVIGDTPASDIELLKGRVVNANMMTLTNDMKKQNMVATFKILSAKELTAETEFLGFSITPAHVRRLTKKAKDKVDDSFKCETKDGKKIVIKPLIMTRKKLQRNILSSLRMTARQLLSQTAKEMTFMDLIDAVLSNEPQKALKQSLKKVYPVSMVEIRSLKIE